MKKLLEFPKGFLWGTATSAHQTEGNNINSNWWDWEVSKKPNDEFPKEASGIACDSYNRYQEDLELCVQLNNNAVRFSVEWARLEPEQGKFNQEEFDHYKKVIKAAKDRYLKVFLTLHHFTHPKWISKQGGWLNPKTAIDFKRYAEKCAMEFGMEPEAYITINEPQVLNKLSYMDGIWPPQHKNLFLSMWVQLVQIMAHRMAYDAIKKLHKLASVGLVKNIMWFEVGIGPTEILDKLVAKILYFLNCDSFLSLIQDKNDFIGLNYYFTNRIQNLKRANIDDWLSDLNWWVNPKGLEHILVDLKKYNLPIYITENGIADANDSLRERFIREMLTSVYNAIQKGSMVKGYFHWSLLDNFEWHQGFWPKFGLVEVDRQNNLARKPRKSFYYYANISRENAFEID